MDRKKKETGRVRKPVFKDFFWREPFVEERLERLEGVVDDSGNNITHEVFFVLHSSNLNVHAMQACKILDI